MSFDKPGYLQKGPSAPTTEPQSAGTQATPACQICGARPAKNVVLHTYLGLLFLVHDRKTKGPFCKQCGTATQRDLSAKAMTRGWWSLPSLTWVPIGLFLNYLRQRQLDKLDDPRGAVSQPLVPGPKAYQRIGPLVTSLVVGIPVVSFLLLIVYVVIESPPVE